MSALETLAALLGKEFFIKNGTKNENLGSYFCVLGASHLYLTTEKNTDRDELETLFDTSLQLQTI